MYTKINGGEGDNMNMVDTGDRIGDSRSLSARVERAESR